LRTGTAGCTMGLVSDKTIQEMTTAELTAELRKLRAMKCWHSATLIERELRNRQPIELAQDAYYYGTAADLRPR
jgi:hypothetical protein